MGGNILSHDEKVLAFEVALLIHLFAWSVLVAIFTNASMDRSLKKKRGRR